MKLKKILSGFLAAAMAVTSMVTASITAGAEDETEPVFQCVSKFTCSNADFANVNATQITKAKMNITYTSSNEYSNGKVSTNSNSTNGGSGWNDVTYGTDGQTNVLTNDTAADVEVPLTVGSDGWFEIGIEEYGGGSLTVNSVSVLDANGVLATISPDFKINVRKYSGSSDLFANKDNFSKIKKVVLNITYTKCDQYSNGKATSNSDSGWQDVTFGTGSQAFVLTQDTAADIEVPMDMSIGGGNWFQFGFEEYGGGSITLNSVKFTDDNGTVLYELPITTHTITIDPDIEHGTVTADKTEAAKGDKVTLTITPDEGYELDTLSVRGANTETGTLNHAFTMPDEDVTVTATFKAKEVALTGITLDKTTATLLVGATTKLTATKTPANTTDTTEITWKSSDETVATVAADGTVTAKAAGTATITATCGEKTATCAVTVTADAKPCTGITLDETAEVTKGKTVTLTATAVPADTTDEITWSSDTPAVATVSATGVVTGVARGTAKITATCGEKTAICEVSVTEDKTVTPPVSVGGQKSYDVVTTAADGTKVKTVDTVYSITEADLQCKGYEVTITNLSNGKSITKTITNAYKSVTVKSAEDLGNDTFTGYFLVVRVKNVPENVTLSYSFKKIS